jgi:hypothetical protein
LSRQLRDHKLQWSLLQFFKPENHFEVRKALEEADRTDLIGGGCDALIPAQQPKKALADRAARAGFGQEFIAALKSIVQSLIDDPCAWRDPKLSTAIFGFAILSCIHSTSPPASITPASIRYQSATRGVDPAFQVATGTGMIEM